MKDIFKMQRIFYPTQNLIFRVHFTLGITKDDEVGTTFYALTTIVTKRDKPKPAS